MQDKGTTQKLITVREALKILPVSREFFYRQIKNGKLPSYRIGCKVLIDPAEVFSAMKQRAQS